MTGDGAHLSDRPVPDAWRRGGAAGDLVLFDMLTGLAPVRGVLGLSDPDVHWIDGRWTMFLGGFTSRFRNALFTAVLPPGAPLANPAWALVTRPGRSRRALAVTADTPHGTWDGHGMHTPSYVRVQRPDGSSEQRIYYAGRATRAHTGPHSRYAIGVLRHTRSGWRRYGPPVHVGTPARPSVFEPLVRHEMGRYRMWYLSAVGEVGSGELPDYRLEYIDSEDGLANWSRPRVLFTPSEGYFDNAVIRVGDDYEMVVARGTNLHGTPDFPPQGLWWLRSERPSGVRDDWTAEPVRLLDTDIDPLPWFARGSCGPSVHYGDADTDRDTLYVFFTGTRARIHWWRTAIARLGQGRRPPVPAPYHLAIGRITIPRPAA